MRYFCFVITLLFSCVGYSQQQDTIVYGNKVFFTGKIYLDGVAIDINKTFLDPDNIKEVRVYGGTQVAIYSHAPKAIFITRKNPVALVQLSTLHRRDSIPVKFVINGKYIEKPEENFIETSAIKGISILDSTKGAMHDPPSRTIQITTRAEYENKD